MFFVVVDFAAAIHCAFPADVVVELPVVDEEGFSAFGPFAFGGSEGGEGAVFSGGLEAGHQGEGFVHGEVFSGEGLEGGIAIGGEGIGDLDPFCGGVARGGKENEGGGIWKVFEGEVCGGLFSRGEFHGMSVEIQSEVLRRSIIEEKAEIGLGIVENEGIRNLGEERSLGLLDRERGGDRRLGRKESWREERKGREKTLFHDPLILQMLR